VQVRRVGARALIGPAAQVRMARLRAHHCGGVIVRRRRTGALLCCVYGVVNQLSSTTQQTVYVRIEIDRIRRTDGVTTRRNAASSLYVRPSGRRRTFGIVTGRGRRRETAPVRPPASSLLRS